MVRIVAKRDYKARLKLKADVELEVAKVLEDKGVDYVKVVEGLVVKVDEDYVVLRAVVKAKDYDLADAVVEYEDKLKALDDKAEAKAKKLAKVKAEKEAKAKAE